MDSKAKRVKEQHEKLESDAVTWKTLWQGLADYVKPQSSNITTQKTPGVEGYTDELFDDTAIHANMTLAAGQLNYLTPHSEQWAGLEPPKRLQGSDEAKTWYATCGEIAMAEIARSNFYLEVHEAYLDRGAFGTAAMLTDEHPEIGLNCRHFDTGSYFVAEDDRGMVNLFSRKFKLTIRQAVERFGIDNVSPKVAKIFNEGQPARLLEKTDYIHQIYYRSIDEREPGKMDPENKPVASVYVDCECDHVCLNGGYDEWPVMVTRFMKWGDEVYGYCPSVACLPTIRQVNFIEKHLDALAELAAFPRVLIPQTMEGAVDLRPAGVTFFNDSAPNSVPREWATQGRYDVGLNRVEQKRQAIERAYHVDLFQMLADRTKQMTAREVMELVEEKLVLFSPTFARMTVEFFTPFMRRVFGILYRAGKFPSPPPEVIEVVNDQPSVPLPEVVYTSKIALAIKALQNKNMLQFMAIVEGIVGVNPEVMDNFDLDKATRGMARNSNVPQDWMRSEKEVAKLRAARQQQQEQMMQMAMAEQGARVAKDASQADPRKLKQMMQ